MSLLDRFLAAGSSPNRIERLLEEQNSLLRELVAAHGRIAQTPRAPLAAPTERKIRTEKDVTRVTREDVIQAEREEQEKLAAIWRYGPGNVPTVQPGGSSSSEDNGS